MGNNSKRNLPKKTVGELVKSVKGKKVSFDRNKRKYNYIDIQPLRTNTIKLFTDNEGVKCNENDILIAWDGSKSGTVGYGLNGVIGSTIAKLIPNNDLVFTPYLAKYLQSKFDFLNSNTSGAAIPHLRKDVLNSLEIYLPNIDIQKKINDKLDTIFQKIDKAISLLEENIENTGHLHASIMNIVYETSKKEKWPIISVKEAFDLKTGGTPSTAHKDKYYGGNIKWLVSGDINQIEIYDCVNRITEEGMKSSNTKILPVDTVLIALNGQGKTRGSVAMLRTEATCNQSLVGMISKDKNKYDPEYLFYNLKSRYIEIRMMTGLNERRGLNMKIIGNIKIPFPSIDKQSEIVSYFKKIFKNIHQLNVPLESKLSSLNSLKTSILDSAFKGEL